MATVIDDVIPNSVTFSPDMTVLYLIDGGQVIPYALNKRNGVLVTVLRGQITVVSAPDIDQAKEEANIAESARAIIPDPVGQSKVPPYPQKLSLPVTGNQFTTMFHPERQSLVVIGVTDIDGAIINQRPPNTLVSVFTLKEKIVNIRRIGERLEFLTINF